MFDFESKEMLLLRRYLRTPKQEEIQRHVEEARKRIREQRERAHRPNFPMPATTSA